MSGVGGNNGSAPCDRSGLGAGPRRDLPMPMGDVWVAFGNAELDPPSEFDCNEGGDVGDGEIAPGKVCGISQGDVPADVEKLR